MQTLDRWCVHALDDDSFYCPTFLSKWVQITLDAWRSWFMLSVIGQRCLAYACIPLPMSCSLCAHAWLMHVGLGWWCLWLIDVARMMHMVHDRCHPNDVQTPWLMCVGLGFRCLPLTDACTSYRCCLANELRPRQKSPNHYAHAMANAWKPWLMQHVVSSHRLQDVHILRPCMQVLTNVEFHWP